MFLSICMFCITFCFYDTLLCIFACVCACVRVCYLQTFFKYLDIWLFLNFNFSYMKQFDFVTVNLENTNLSMFMFLCMFMHGSCKSWTHEGKISELPCSEMSVDSEYMVEPLCLMGLFCSLCSAVVQQSPKTCLL